LVELIGATSIIDFANKDDKSFKTKNRTEYFDFGIKNEDQVIDIRHFYDTTRQKIMYPLTLFTYAMKIYLENIPDFKKESFYKQLDLGANLKNDLFYQNLTAFFNIHYRSWLTEMMDNEREFQPFNVDSDLNSLVRERKISTSFLSKGISQLFLKDKLGKIENELKDTENNKRFLEMLNRIAEECFKKLESLPSMV